MKTKKQNVARTAERTKTVSVGMNAQTVERLEKAAGEAAEMATALILASSETR